MGIRRQVGVTVESFLLAPFLIRGTQLITLVLERAAKHLVLAESIHMLDPPFDVPDIHEAMYWHPRHTTDPGHQWLRHKLRHIASKLEQSDA